MELNADGTAPTIKSYTSTDVGSNHGDTNWNDSPSTQAQIQPIRKDSK